MTLDPCEPKAGTWRLALEVTNHSGNLRRLKVSDLAAAGWPNSFSVLTNDNRPPGAEFSVDEEDPQAVTLHFDEDVSGVNNDSVILYLGPEMVDDFHVDTARAADRRQLDMPSPREQEATDCLSGNVRTATFDPAGDDPWDTSRGQSQPSTGPDGPRRESTPTGWR